MRMTETLLSGTSTKAGADIGDTVYWVPRSQRTPGRAATADGHTASDQEEDLAATPTPQRPIIPRSLTIPETVDENALLATHTSSGSEDTAPANTSAKFCIDDDEPESRDRLQTIIHCGPVHQVKGRQAVGADSEAPSKIPWAVKRLLRSSSAATQPLECASETDLLQLNSHAPVASPLMVSRLMSSSPPCGPVVVRRGSSGGVANAILTKATRPLRTSSSATHLPMLHSANSSAAKCSSPYFYSQHPQYAAAMLSSQMSDTESIGSGDSMQDLTSTSQSAVAPISGNLRWHRQSFGGGGIGSAFHPLRGPMGNVAADSVSSMLSSSPTNSVCSVRTAFNAQAMPNNFQQAQLSQKPQAVSAGRSVSSNLFDDELLSRVGSAASGTATPFGQNVHYTAKHLRTEKVVSKHSLKGRLTKLQRLLDKAFSFVNIGTEEAIIDGCNGVAHVMFNAWLTPKIGHDLAYGLCDYLR